MLRRSGKPQTTAPDAAPTDGPATGPKAQGQSPKGYATPTRKEAEAARKAKLGGLPADPKARRKVVNAQRSTQYQIERQAVRSGDARNYPARDFGPARAFVRNYVDGRLRVLEFTLPVVIACYGIIVFGRSSVGASLIALYLMTISMFSLIVFGLMLSNRVKKAVGEQFGPAEARGTGLYAFSRAVNPRFLRKPKPVVTLSGQPKG